MAGRDFSFGTGVLCLAQVDDYYMLALDPERTPNGPPEEDPPETIEFKDTTRWRASMVQEVLEDKPARFRWKDRAGREWSLRPLTIGLYRKHLRQGVEGKLQFKSTEELLSFYRSFKPEL